jgi:hypothetical protein
MSSQYYLCPSWHGMSLGSTSDLSLHFFEDHYGKGKGMEERQLKINSKPV